MWVKTKFTLTENYFVVYCFSLTRKIGNVVANINKNYTLHITFVKPWDGCIKSDGQIRT